MNQGIYEELVTKLISFKLNELDKNTFQVKTKLFSSAITLILFHKPHLQIQIKKLLCTDFIN
jgi:hypothetical protein